ncbi:TlpA family protein disulfide reductase [Protaetiibacter larvae]|uniref:TlpA family protein disulfide reductase n=1 Tax=Protaetiibacter larvae TaxID=2592654 RepID=A0A5C1YA67_9MICO|nr:TlpA family protein disulfide reductase [Protaetiibacter larvae]
MRLAVPAVALAALLAGCTEQASHLTEVYEQGAGDYVSGDGRIITLAADKRDPAVEFAGTLDTGEAFSSADVAGRVVVVNFWYAACPPCREEAPELEKLRAQFEANGAEASIVGVNVSDTADVALGFEKDHGVGYPSIVDAADNAVQLAFADNRLPQNSVPTTLILDRQGRVAARVSGLITSPSVVSDIVDTLLAEKA